MPRSTAAAAADRRRKVEVFLLRGQRPTAIARQLGCDKRTIARDIQSIAGQWAADADVKVERQRLLSAARHVEAESWQVYERASDENAKLGALGKALAAQERAATLLGQLEAAGLAGELAQLRAEVDQLAGRTRLATRGGIRLVERGEGA